VAGGSAHAPSCLLASSFGQVAERSKAADCKSAGPCGLRRFESSPVHHLETGSWKLENGEVETGSQSTLAGSDFQFPISIFQVVGAGVTQW
jgi:hypothetical protein